LGRALRLRVGGEKGGGGGGEKAGLKSEERLSPHALRHGYASRLGLGGLNPVTLARIIGHTDASFTMRAYCADQRSVEAVAEEVLRIAAI
jgi:integrase